jgi:hypothetical protein
MTDPVELLVEDHNKVRDLFKRFEGADDALKGNLFREIDIELQVHTQIEEEIFYPAVRKVKELEEMVGEAYEEHNIVDYVLGEMRKLSPGDDTFEYKFTTLKENAEHHAEEEEKEMFPKVSAQLPGKEEIGRKMLERKQELMEQLQKRRSSVTRSRSTASRSTSSRSGSRSGTRSTARSRATASRSR